MPFAPGVRKLPTLLVDVSGGAAGFAETTGDRFEQFDRNFAEEEALGGGGVDLEVGAEAVESFGFVFDLVHCFNPCFVCGDLFD